MRTLQVSTPAREPLPFVLPLAHGIGHRAGLASYRGGLFRHQLALGAPLARCRRLSAKLLSVVHELERVSTEQLRRARHDPRLQRRSTASQPCRLGERQFVCRRRYIFKTSINIPPMTTFANGLGTS